MKQLEVQIMGQSYLLGCPEGGEPQLLEAVGKVDAAMCKIRDAGKVRARDRIAVLAALNLAFDLSDQHLAATTPSMPMVPATDSGTETAESSTLLKSLLERLDATLGDDGQLL